MTDVGPGDPLILPGHCQQYNAVRFLPLAEVWVGVVDRWLDPDVAAVYGTHHTLKYWMVLWG